VAKLIKILAASVGGGLVLGAGIRLGEAIAGGYPVAGPDSGRKLSERLGELENRLVSLEGDSGIFARSQFSGQDRQREAPGDVALQLRGELREWLEESVAARMAELELRLRGESERGRKQMLDAFAESVQTRVIQRISRLEEEVAGQSAAVSELRECSLRTEKSMQKLLGGLDKLVVRQHPAPEEAVIDSSSADRVSPHGAATPTETSPKSSPPPGTSVSLASQPEPPAFAPQLKSRRWKIFG